MRTFYISREQLACVAAKTRSSRYSMDCFRIREDGSVEFTDGVLMLRAERSWDDYRKNSEGSIVVPAASAQMVLKVAPHPKEPGVVIEEHEEELQVKFRAKNWEEVCIKFPRRISHDFPPCDEVWDDYAEMDVAGSAYLNVDKLEKLVKCLKRAGSEHVKIDIPSDEKTLKGVRITAITRGRKRVCGILMGIRPEHFPK